MGLTQETFVFSQFWRLEVPRSRLWQGSALGDNSLLNSWLLCPYVVFLLSRCTDRWTKRYMQRENSLVSFLLRILILQDWGPTFVTSFNLNLFLKSPMS